MTDAPSDGPLVLAIAARSCAAEDLDDEIVALNVGTGVYFSIRETGVALWRDLASGHSVEQLAALGRDLTGSDASVRRFVAQVQEHGLMRAVSAGPKQGTPQVSEPFAAGRTNVVFEVHTDMQDLILSDPIHDVDEAVGWPATTKV